MGIRACSRTRQAESQNNNRERVPPFSSVHPLAVMGMSPIALRILFRSSPGYFYQLRLRHRKTFNRNLAPSLGFGKKPKQTDERNDRSLALTITNAAG